MAKGDDGLPNEQHVSQSTEISNKLKQIFLLKSFGLLTWIVLVGIYYQVNPMNNYLALFILHLVVLGTGAFIIRIEKSIDELKRNKEPRNVVETKAENDPNSGFANNWSTNNTQHAVFFGIMYVLSILVIFFKVGFHIPQAFGIVSNSVFTVTLTIIAFVMYKTLLSFNKLSKE